MARASRELIAALRKTVLRLRSGAPYQWGHLGACNCGHLAQTLTKLSKGEIHKAALERDGDWGEVSQEYCETSGLRVDTIIESMLGVGLNLNDIEYLENLNDKAVLKHMGKSAGGLKHNDRDHVIAYMEAWAQLLETQLTSEPPTEPPEAVVTEELIVGAA